MNDEDSINKDRLRDFFHASMDDQHELKDRIEPKPHRYVIRQRIGQGGMKNVYRVWDPLIGREVAFATLRCPDHEESFYREAHLTAKLDHPGIIRMYEIGCDQTPYFTMELLSGQTLDKLIATSSLKSLLHNFLKICDAISYAHHKGIIHLDIKPENIHIAPFGKVTVCDWGIAKIIDEEFRDEILNQDTLNHATLMGHIKGTPGFMAPEQANGRGEKDVRTDIYALGAILYFMITKKAPVKGDSVSDILEKTRNGDISTPTQHQGLSSVSMKALSFNPMDRYKSIELLKEEVLRYLNDHPTLAEDAHFIKQFELFYKRNKVHCRFIILGVLMVILFSIIHISSQNRSLSETKIALAYAQDMKNAAIKNLNRLTKQMEITNQLTMDKSDLYIKKSIDYRYRMYFLNPKMYSNQAKKLLYAANEIYPGKERALNFIIDIQFTQQHYREALDTMQNLGRPMTPRMQVYNDFIQELNGELNLSPPTKALVLLFEELQKVPEESHHLLERFLVYDQLLRKEHRDYEPLLHQLIKSWNPNVNFNLKYDKNQHSLKVQGKEISILHSDTRLGSGKSLLRFIKVKDLDISGTAINTLKLTQGLNQLQSLNIAKTPIKHLALLKDHVSLNRLLVSQEQFSSNQLKDQVPKGIHIEFIEEGVE
ncbi:MAG: serine/threonine protein kinase [Planctomycetes bacterium]|nr:serine/threonine protein kinase [Planctomycetota bacterium]